MMTEEFTEEELEQLSKDFVEDIQAVFDKFMEKRCFPSSLISTMGVNFFIQCLREDVSILEYSRKPRGYQKKLGSFYAQAFSFPTEEYINS